MNERIKQLEKQATTVVEGWSDENGTTRYYEFNREKFAELIVEECVAQIKIERGNPYRNMGDNALLGVGACDESIRRIKEHFGVEE